jgi:hypothetical protein
MSQVQGPVSGDVLVYHQAGKGRMKSRERPQETLALHPQIDPSFESGSPKREG